MKSFVRWLGFLGLFVALGCGYPRPIDPPTFWHESAIQSALAANLHARDVTSRGGRGIVLSVLGPTESMGKTLSPYDFAVLDALAPFSERKVGEIISYVGTGPDWEGRSSEAPIITHRIVAKDQYGLLCSGDSNPRSEARSRVTETNYRGLIVGIYKTGKKP